MLWLMLFTLDVELLSFHYEHLKMSNISCITGSTIHVVPGLQGLKGELSSLKCHINVALIALGVAVRPATWI